MPYNDSDVGDIVMLVTCSCWRFVDVGDIFWILVTNTFRLQHSSPTSILNQFCDLTKDLIIKSSNRETPEKQIVKTDQNGNEETKGEMDIMLPDNQLYKFIEIQPIETIFREQVSYFGWPIWTPPHVGEMQGFWHAMSLN